MIKPVMLDPQDSSDELVFAMEEQKYPHIEDHEPILEHAVILTCFNDEEIAGYCWFYRWELDQSKWIFHVLTNPRYQKKFFSRTLLTTIFNFVWVLGADTIVVEDDYKDLLARVGGDDTELGCELKLPFDWRKTWAAQSKKL